LVIVVCRSSPGFVLVESGVHDGGEDTSFVPPSAESEEGMEGGSGQKQGWSSLGGPPTHECHRVLARDGVTV